MKQFETFVASSKMLTRPMVFVVDDDPDYCRLLRRLMESVSLPIETFSSARKFLDAYDPTVPGCLILDLRMPDMSGLELLRILTARDNYLPVIMLTAFADVPTTVEAMKCGAKDVLEKPHRPQHLIEIVQQALKEDIERCQRTRTDAEIRDCLDSLTPRETEVLEFLLSGQTSKQISRELKISVRTADFHRRNVLEKMQTDNPVQLARLIDALRFRQSYTSSPR